MYNVKIHSYWTALGSTTKSGRRENVWPRKAGTMWENSAGEAAVLDGTLPPASAHVSFSAKEVGAASQKVTPRCPYLNIPMNL